MEEISGWVAPIATTVAAMMTAANLGPRITGWGFVVFTIGSIAWLIVAIASGQENLLWTNAFLTVVNITGIWRWLVRQARYQDGSELATTRSATSRVPTLVALGSIAGTNVTDSSGAKVGVVVDGMLRCADTSLAYVVVSEGGAGGVGEQLRALHPDELTLSEDGMSCSINLRELRNRPVLTPNAWPASIERDS